MGNDPTGAAMGGMMGAEMNPIMKMYTSLPAWGQATVKTLLVMIAAAFLGMILGKLYASVRYPDPDKNSAISPRVRIVFLVVLLICGVWLYRTMTFKEEPAEPVGGDPSSMPTDEYAPEGGGTYSNIGGGVAMGGGVAIAVG